MELFTETEQLTLVDASMTLPAIELWYDKAPGAQIIDLETHAPWPDCRGLWMKNLISGARGAGHAVNDKLTIPR